MFIAMLVYWMVNCPNKKKYPPAKNNKQRHGATPFQWSFLVPLIGGWYQRPGDTRVGQARLRFWAKEIQAAVQAGRHCRPCFRDLADFCRLHPGC